MELTPWKLPTGMYTMEVTSRTLQYGSYLMELRQWKGPHGVHTTEVTSWNVYNGI